MNTPKIDSMKDRAIRDPEYRESLLVEALKSIKYEELDVAKILLREYINACIEAKK